MRIVALYTVFNGLELLDKSIECIFPHVDEILICYQEKSNKGNRSETVFPAVKKYIGQHKFNVIGFEPHLDLNTKENERRKHNRMLDFAKRLNCTHFLFMATDHFYLHEEFERAKHNLLLRSYDATFSQMFTYYKHPTWQLTPPEEYYMPFICRLYPETKVVQCRRDAYPAYVDPALMINTCATYHKYAQSELMMHHYSMIRNDIKDKFANAAASIRWKPEQVQTFIDEFENYNPEENKPITYFGGRTVKVVKDWFGLAQ